MYVSLVGWLVVHTRKCFSLWLLSVLCHCEPLRVELFQSWAENALLGEGWKGWEVRGDAVSYVFRE